MPHLILARTKTDTDTSNNKTITRKLNSWLQGDIKSQFSEAKALQTRLPKGRAKTRDAFREFDSHMSSGKISNALRCLDDQQKGNVLSGTDRIEGKTVLQILCEKHPKPQTAPDAYKLTEADDNTLPVHSSVFDRKTPAAVRKAALRTNGSHGPSGLDANEWPRHLTNFDQSSVNLCRTIAEFARKLATVSVTSEHLVPYNACRLIPLDKQPESGPLVSVKC